METIVSGVVDLAEGLIEAFSGDKRSRYERLPEWADPKDYQRSNNTMLWMAIMIILGLTILVSSVVISQKAK